MVAVEFVKPGEGDGRVPDPALTKRVQQECFARNLLLLTAGTYVNVIRIIPPLVTTAEEVDQALGDHRARRSTPPAPDGHDGAIVDVRLNTLAGSGEDAARARVEAVYAAVDRLLVVGPSTDARRR